MAQALANDDCAGVVVQFRAMEQVAENLRYLLWCADVPRPKWGIELAKWISSGIERSKELLISGNLQPHEQARIAKLAHCSEEDIQFTRLIERMPSKRGSNRVDILSENVRFLIGELDHGKRKHLAATINVTPNSVSRWASGRNRPPKTKLLGLRRYFGLPDRTNLERDAVFLDPAPVSVAARKLWLHKQIDRMESSDLQNLFPALERLLRDK